MVSTCSMASAQLHRSRHFTRRCPTLSICNNENIQRLAGLKSRKHPSSQCFSSDNKFHRCVGNGGSKTPSSSLSKISNISSINAGKLYGVEFQSSKVSLERTSETGYFDSDANRQIGKPTSAESSYRSKQNPRNDKNFENSTKRSKQATLIKYQDVESSIYNHFYYHYYHSKNNPVYRENMPLKTKFPVLDASPLFDPALFCRKSALTSGDASICGTAAAKRLRQGKQLAVDLLQHDLCNWGPSSKVVYYDDDVEEDTFLDVSLPQKNKNEEDRDTENGDETKTLKVQSPPWTREGGVSLLQSQVHEVNNFDSSIKSSKWRKRKCAKKYEQKKSKAFVLEGHGVPFQLFQDHIDLCDTLLSKHGGATECTFNNFDGKLTVDWMRVRGRDGKNFVSPWPARNRKFESDMDEFEQRLHLYLAVMNRLSTTFGKVLDPNPVYSHHIINPLYANFASDEDDDRVDTTRPRHWNVQFLRGMAYPSYIIPSPKKLSPIVELTQRAGIAAPRNVRICLQSVPSSRGDNLNGDGPVTLVFDACFSKTLLRR